MPRKNNSQKKPKILTKEVLLNGAISLAGILLLGFIFSFSKNKKDIILNSAFKANHSYKYLLTYNVFCDII